MREISTKHKSLLMSHNILFILLSISLFSLYSFILTTLNRRRKDEIRELDDFNMDFKRSNLIFFDKNFKKNKDKIRENLSRKKLIPSNDREYFVRSDEIPQEDIKTLVFQNSPVSTDGVKDS